VLRPHSPGGFEAMPQPMLSCVERRTREWDEIASLDPEWSILSEPTRRHGRWATAEFFETGRVEIQAALTKAAGWEGAGPSTNCA
jgi:hypothetical protein